MANEKRKKKRQIIVHKTPHRLGDKNLRWLFISSIVIHQTVQFHNNKV